MIAETAINATTAKRTTKNTAGIAAAPQRAPALLAWLSGEFQAVPCETLKINTLLS
jgi:hypothetical protein